MFVFVLADDCVFVNEELAVLVDVVVPGAVFVVATELDSVLFGDWSDSRSEHPEITKVDVDTTARNDLLVFMLRLVR